MDATSAPWKQADLFGGHQAQDKAEWLRPNVPALPLWIGELAWRTGVTYEQARVFLQMREDADPA